MQETIRVFHIEDYKIVRDGIKFLLSQDSQIKVVGEAENTDQLLRAIDTTTMDVLLLDLYLDSMGKTDTPDGFEICRWTKAKHPHVKVIAHSVYDDADSVSKIMNAGANGFVSKKAGYHELIHAIKTVQSGKRYVCKETASKVKNLNKFLTGIERNLEGMNEIFSKREKEVLELLAKGYSSRAIAEELSITERTVESHRKNLVTKAGVKNTVALVAFAWTRGIIKK